MEEEAVNKKAEEGKKKKRTSWKSILGGDIPVSYTHLDVYKRQDLGNPPFGHSGERAISTFFSEGKGQRLQEKQQDGEPLSQMEWRCV